MLDRVVDYLHARGVPFRVSSQPSPEPLPAIAETIAPGALLVQTSLVRVDGRPGFAVHPVGQPIGLAAIRSALGARIVEPAELAELGGDFATAACLPPLGGMFGVPVFLDERVVAAPLVAFSAFAPGDLVALSYDDYARIEQPRIGSFAPTGELPAHQPAP